MTHASWKIATALVVATSAAPVHADSAAAESLFRDGRALIKQGKLAQGCEKIQASQKIEASVGTLLNLGDCREKLGQLASAWAAFREAEALAKRKGNDGKRQAEASRRASALEPRLSNLVIEVPSPVEGLVIKRDNEIVDRGGWNTPLPVDPSAHVVVAEAPGYKPWKLEVTVDPRSRRRIVQVPRLERLAVTETPTDSPIPPPVIVTQPTTAVLVKPRPRSRTWSTTRGVAVAVGVLGAGSLVTGAYFGSRADDLQKQSDAICPTLACDDPEGLRLNDKAQKQASRANIAFGLGGAAAVAAGVMWFLGKPDDEMVVAPVMSDSQAGVSLRGRF